MSWSTTVLAGLTCALTLLLIQARRQLAAEREGSAWARALARAAETFAFDARRPVSLARALMSELECTSTFEEMHALLERSREEVIDAVMAVEALIEDVLEARSDTPLRRTRIELERWLRAAVTLVSRTSGSPAPHVEYELKHSLCLTADGPKLARVFANLVAYAVHAVRDGGRIWIRSSDAVRTEGAFLSIVVGNSGTIIPHRDLPTIFEPFASSGRHRGRDLGLAIVKKIVREHRGEVTCRSSPEIGVEFTIILPAEAARQEPAPPTAGQGLPRARLVGAGSLAALWSSGERPRRAPAAH